MAATEGASRVLAATLLLPGLAAVSGARAEEPPQEGVLSLKVGWYRDEQPDLERIRVTSPQIHVLMPLAGQWSLEAAGVIDSLSGATPRIHTFKSSASAMEDHRAAGDVKVTRYFRRAAVAVGAAYSHENDYLSRTLSAEGRFSSEDNNTTWTFGVAPSQDRIDTTNTGGNAFGERRRTTELMGGITQVLTPDDALQVLLTRSIGSGYYTDPYKDFDNRPRARRANIALTRWNHHFDGPDATLRASWRYYNDTFGVRSHTFGAEWVQPFGKWTLAPSVRYYQQGAAWFYYDPVPNATGEPNSLQTRLFLGSLTGFSTADHRMAAFGAVTLSMKVAYAFTPATSVDLKVETYKQAGHLRYGGGSPYLAPMTAHFVQLGVAHKF